MTYAGGAVREYGLKQRTISRFGLGSEVGCTQGILARRTMSATYNRKFSKYYDCITGHKDYETETQRLAGLIKEHVNKSGARLLDVGCGTGTHAALLKDKGFSVVGIDVSREMIEVAQDKHKGVKFLACDVADLNDQGFEFSYSLYNVVNCLGSLDGLMAYFKAISARLVPGALFFVEAWNPIAVIAVPPAEVTREFEVGDEKILRKVHPRPDFVNQRLELIYDISVSKKMAAMVLMRFRWSMSCSCLHP